MRKKEGEKERNMIIGRETETGNVERKRYAHREKYKHSDRERA